MKRSRNDFRRHQARRRLLGDLKGHLSLAALRRAGWPVQRTCMSFDPWTQTETHAQNRQPILPSHPRLVPWELPRLAAQKPMLPRNLSHELPCQSPNRCRQLQVDAAAPLARLPSGGCRVLHLELYRGLAGLRALHVLVLGRTSSPTDFRYVAAPIFFCQGAKTAVCIGAVQYLATQ
ncbi:hypothetical protein BU16DRAFT_526673 [Lophium mytilinum]|uniref:Uncharacterized protein n=1 Tax=Lophium mytilinum TaxID=390894 RepID=A0A6A6QWV0_9PEZI|nr:hypothetical protein BU16DRAFT_526673 [Lophium mytilinum]